jgi:hypothetical protein
MERIEFFGAAVFVPVFLVSIGLLLDPSVMFTGHTLGLAALMIMAALGGKAIACALAGPLMGFSRIERLAMYVLTIPQAAATLAATLIGFEIGVFGTSVVNAVLVLILVSIVVAALLAQRVVAVMPTHVHVRPPLGSKILVVTSAAGPSDAAVRLATLLARPDGGHSNVLIVHGEAEPAPDQAALRSLERRIYRHGFDGHVRTGINTLAGAVSHAGDSSLVIVDDPAFVGTAGRVPLLVLQDDPSAPRLICDGDGTDGLEAEIGRRLARGAQPVVRRLRKRTPVAPDA